MSKLLDILLWVIITVFSPAAGLNEIEEERELDNEQANV